MKRRVVITGIGPVSSIGTGRDCFFENIIKHNLKVREIPGEFEKNYKFLSRFYVPAPSFSLSDFGIHQSLESAMEGISKLSSAAAKLAIEDAGFNPVPDGKYFHTDGLKDCQVIVGVGMSSLQTALNSYVPHIFGDRKELLDGYTGSKHYNRMVIPLLMPNAASAWISIIFGIKGCNYTINASCASATYAIGEAYRRISQGLCSTAITGGVECLKEKYGAIMRGFDALGTLTRSKNGAPMPFSKQRSGFLFSEGGGCMLVLEDMDSAVKRRANIYAEICGYECNSDACNIVQMDQSGEQIAAILNKVSHGRKIDYLNAHGTATLANDEIEAAAIRTVFGDELKQPLINSTKGVLGHSIGASGAFEAAVTALSIYYSKVHPNIIEDPMDNLNIATRTVDRDIRYAISASYGFGGHNAAILFKRFGKDDG